MNNFGYCRCGCGQQTQLSTRADPRWGYVIGQPKPFIKGHAQIGQRNWMWKGDEASDKAKRQRARKRFALGSCERCPKNGVERHHKDGNPGNNSPENIIILCRRCHMLEDGRLKKIALHLPVIQPKKPCVGCGKKYKPLRRGMCSACYERQRDRKAEQLKKKPFMVTLVNDFHGTCVNLAVNLDQPLTPSQIRRARRVLCGIPTCTCGGPLGERGPQQGVFVEQSGSMNISLRATDE